MSTEQKCEVCGVLLYRERLDVALVSLTQPGLAWCWEIRGRVKDKGHPWIPHPHKGYPWMSHPSKEHPYWFITTGIKITQNPGWEGFQWSLLSQGKAHPGCSFLRDAHPNPSCTTPGMLLMLLLPHSQAIYSSISVAPSQKSFPQCPAKPSLVRNESNCSWFNPKAHL